MCPRLSVALSESDLQEQGNCTQDSNIHLTLTTVGTVVRLDAEDFQPELWVQLLQHRNK